MGYICFTANVKSLNGGAKATVWVESCKSAQYSYTGR